MKRPSVVAGDFFVMRTPMLPWEELEVWSADLTACHAAGDDLPAALAADRITLRERLRAIVARPEVAEALFLSSPGLFDSLGEWLDEPAGDRGRKVERALVRYLSRMAGRATPFGLCAGSCMGRLGQATALLVGDRSRHARCTRLDMDYVCSLARALARDESIAGSILYYPNSSLYQVGERMRYAEVAIDPETGQERHRLTSVAAGDHLPAVLELARHGATRAELAERLAAAAPDVTPAEVVDYLGQLIDNGILVSSLEPEVTGGQPVRLLVERLRGLPPAAVLARRAADCLDSVERTLSALDSQPIGTGLAHHLTHYRDVAQALESLPAEIDRSRLFQVELFKKPSSSTLGPEVVSEIEGAFDVAWRLTALPRFPALARFADAFARRYETREIPLPEAVDPDLGVGFGQSDDAARAGRSMTWTARALFLHRRLRELREVGAREWSITPADVEELLAVEPDGPAIPDALSFHFSLFTPSSPSRNPGDFRLLFDGAVGPPGARLLGRFVHGDDELREAVSAELRVEESRRPDAIYAEVVHLPTNRAGNVILRPLLRGYEIPYLARSGAPAERQIPVSDLRVSVRDGLVRLRSERLDREVIPRLTTAHDFLNETNLPVYRFLCELQCQGAGGGMSWIWQSMVHEPFLPRVSYGRVLLSLASWALDGERLQDVVHAQEPFAAVQGLRKRLGLPRHVGVADSDHLLPVDLDNVLCVDSLIHFARQRRRVTLFELCPDGWQSGATGPEGRFVHQIIMPLRRATSPLDARPAPPQRTVTTGRSFPPGSEWLFVKLHAGEATGERVLRQVVHQVVRDGASAGLFDCWFFVRYADPDHHLRLRFHGAGQRLLGELLPAIKAAVSPFLDDRQVWRMQVDTYEREVERYGGLEAMALAEAIFHADSDAALELIATAGEESEEERLRIAALGLDVLLGDFGLDAAARLDVLQGLRDDRARELGIRSFKAIGERFRRERPALERLFEQARSSAAEAARAIETFRTRSNRLRKSIEQLHTLATAGRLSVPITQLARTHLHMHANRLIKTDLRQQELFLYDVLARLHRSWTINPRRD